MILGDTSTHNSLVMGKSLLPHPETNQFAWRLKVCLRNPITQLRYDFNDYEIQHFENLKKYREYDKIQNIRVCTKYKK